ncbi:MAG: PilZ domain-containing protein [Candidatus Sulfotelmatobacter sp.]
MLVSAGKVKKKRLTVIINSTTLPMPSADAKRAMKSVDRRRRRHPRYRGDFIVSVNHLLGDDYQKIEGHCRDLSEAGMGIILAAELNSGEVVGLSFRLPESALAFDVRAVVRHRRGYQYGFEFLSLSPEQRDMLKDFFQGREPVD